MRRLGGVLSVNKSSTVRNALSVYLLVDSLFANRKYRKIRHGLKEWHASDSHSLVLVYGWSAIEKLTSGVPVIREFLRSIRTSRPGGSNLCSAALASLSIGDYTSQCTPSG